MPTENKGRRITWGILYTLHIASHILVHCMYTYILAVYKMTSIQIELAWYQMADVT